MLEDLMDFDMTAVGLALLGWIIFGSMIWLVKSWRQAFGIPLMIVMTVLMPIIFYVCAVIMLNKD